MQDAILYLVQQISGILAGLGSTNGYLTAGIGAFSGVYSTCKGIANGVCSPIAYTILTILLLIDLHKVVLQLSQQGGGGTIAPIAAIRTVLKYMFVKWAIDHSVDLLGGIFSLCAQVTSRLQASLSPSIISTLKLEQAVNDLDVGILSGLGAWVLLAVAMLLAGATVIYVNVVVLARFVKVYFYVALSPVPIAFLADDQTTQIGIGFLKGFAGVCLQSAVIALAIRLFPMFAADISATSQDMLGFAMQIMLLCMVLMTCVGSSGQLAKEVFGS